MRIPTQRYSAREILTRNLLLLVLTGLASALGGCGTTSPQIPEDLSSAESFPVKKKKFILFSGERLNFGEYKVDKVRRDTSQKIDRSGSSRIAMEYHEDYSFRMKKSDQGSWLARCRSDANRSDRIPFIGPLKEQGYHVALGCELDPSESGPAWTLKLVEDDSSGRVLHGTLTDGARSIQVEGSRAMGKTSKEDSHTLFEFSGQEGVLGAVVLLQGDRVLFHPSTDHGLRPALAAAATALILYRDSNERMKDIVEARLQSDRGMIL